MANTFADPYAIRILYGAAEELKRNGVSVISCSGRFPDAPIYRDAEGAPALPQPVEGWIVLAETLRGSAAELERVAGTSPRPLVSVGTALAGVLSIAANDETGVFQAVAHLAKLHDRRRIAFIAGPDASVDGARRLEGYRIALESLGLAADPTLVAIGDYEARSGREAVRQLRRHATLPFDAIVAANDLMAIGAIEGLRASGLQVPRDVSVVGFDDMEEASFALPTLTTVRQPLHEQGVAAARMLLRQLAGKRPEEGRTIIPTPLVIRQSCGCRSASAEGSSYPPGLEGKKDQELLEGALREMVRHELASARRQRELSRLADDILRATDFPELCPVMGDVVGLLELRRLLLCTYAGSQRQVRIALESTGQRVVFHHQSHAFAIEQLLPPGFLKQESPVELSIEPLELAGEQFGYLVLDGDVRRGHAYLDLRRYLGCALGRMAHGRELRRLYGEKRRTGFERPPSTPPPRR